MKIANRNNGDAGVFMKPEGAVKVVVLNGSRQIDQVVAGAGNNGEAGWVTQKVLPENGLQQLGRTLLHIRMLARGPVTAETGQVIHDLADALHNVPGAIVGTDPSKDELLRAALSDAAGVYQKAGIAGGRA